MSPQEVSDLLKPCFVNLDKTPEQIVNWIFDNSHEIESKISWYSLERKQIIPKVQVKDYPIALNDILKEKQDKIPVFCNLMLSNNIQERCWANECYISLSKKIYNKQISEQKFDEYLKRLEIEADIIKDISNKLEDCLFAYFNTFKHYIDLFWECGSIVGPGRGSATGFLSNYLLGITQLDPVRWNLPYWRLT
jgi:DNA polymerase-3 subunit alpha